MVVNVDAIADGIPEPITDYTVDITSSSSLGAGAPYDGLSTSIIVTIFDTEDSIILYVPNYGLIMIENWQAQNVYQSPSHGIIRNADTTEMILPHDWDGNGFDTYVVTDIRTYGDETWLGIWLGNNNYGWVVYDPTMMTVVNPIDWDIQSEWTP